MATPPDFSVGQVLTAAHMDAVGMWKVGGGSYSAANPIAIEGCFTSDFTHYRVVGALYGSNASQDLNLNFYTGTNTLYNSLNHNRWGHSFSGGTFTSQTASANATCWISVTSNTSTLLSSFTIDIFNPNEAVRTKLQSTSLGQNAVIYTLYYDLANTETFTGFQLDAAAGSLTGTVNVYGMRV